LGKAGSAGILPARSPTPLLGTAHRPWCAFAQLTRSTHRILVGSAVRTRLQADSSARAMFSGKFIRAYPDSPWSKNANIGDNLHNPRRWRISFFVMSPS